MNAMKMSISDLNELTQEAFIDRFANIVQNIPLCAASVCSNRPFQSLDDLFHALCEFLDPLPSNGQEGILRYFPDLAGRLAKMGALSAESTREQHSALSSLTDQESIIINEFNQRYKQKFGFPFVICCRMNNKENIIDALKARMENDRETERKTGIEEAKKIMLLRLKDIVKSKL
jgi:2-oxo-4-hydroxy-4-carboxy-5-ureidoimidazoline decarboxylase